MGRKFVGGAARLMSALRLAMAAGIAAGVSAQNAEAQSDSEAAAALRAAQQAGTADALQQFIEDYPLSPEADVAFRSLVVESVTNGRDEPVEAQAARFGVDLY